MFTSGQADEKENIRTFVNDQGIRICPGMKRKIIIGSLISANG